MESLLLASAIIGRAICFARQRPRPSRGPASLLSFVLAVIVCAFAGLCYAELSSTLPSPDRPIDSYTTLGEFAAWIMGALLLLEYGLAASVVAVGWGGYVVSLLADFGLQIPAQLTGPAGYTLMHDGQPVLVDGQTVTTLFNLPAFLICAALAALLCIGVSESAKVNNVIVAIKVSVLVAFIVVGGLIVLSNLGEYAATNWTPFIPPNEGDGKFGVDGIMRAASIVFFAYIGFEAVSTAGQEAKNPAKDMPFGIIGRWWYAPSLRWSRIMTLLSPTHSSMFRNPRRRRRHFGRPGLARQLTNRGDHRLDLGGAGADSADSIYSTRWAATACCQGLLQVNTTRRRPTSTPSSSQPTAIAAASST